MNLETYKKNLDITNNYTTNKIMLISKLFRFVLNGRAIVEFELS